MTQSRPLRLEQHPKDATESSSPVPTGWGGEVNEQLVSVVIPCYNQAHFLGEAIESVLKQTYPHYEIVVVDDGSTDNTSEVASHYGRVHLIRQDNQGVNAARNTGIRHSRGEYLVFLDADDRLLPEALQAGLECFASHPECAFVFGHDNFIAVDGSFLRTPTPPLIGSELLTVLLSRSFYVIPGEVMIRRFALEAVGLFDLSLDASEDYELYFRIIRKYPVFCHGRVILDRRLHEASTTRNAGKMLKGTVNVLRAQKRYTNKDKLLTIALRAGISRGRREYGVPLARQVWRWASEGEWRRALGGAWTLLRYYPQGLALLVNGRRPAWQLKSRNEQLQQRDRKIQQLNSVLEKERAENRRLRKQSRQSERRARNLQRQLQEVHGSETWKLLLKLARLRAKVGGGR